MSAMNVIELRNYLLKPGTRDSFIKYFKKHFIKSQEILGSHIPGLFRVGHENDRFFWIRGFKSMEERSRFLPTFYGGEVWKEFGPAANDMMLEWHDVYLLKPVKQNTLLTEADHRVIVIDYYMAKKDCRDQLICLFNNFYFPLLNKQGISNGRLWVGEMSKNDFSRLPVYQYEELLACITTYKNEMEYELLMEHIELNAGKLKAQIQNLVTVTNKKILYPA